MSQWKHYNIHYFLQTSFFYNILVVDSFHEILHHRSEQTWYLPSCTFLSMVESCLCTWICVSVPRPWFDWTQNTFSRTQSQKTHKQTKRMVANQRLLTFRWRPTYPDVVSALMGFVVRNLSEQVYKSYLLTVSYYYYIIHLIKVIYVIKY